MLTAYIHAENCTRAGHVEAVAGLDQIDDFKFGELETSDDYFGISADTIEELAEDAREMKESDDRFTARVGANLLYRLNIW